MESLAHTDYVQGEEDFLPALGTISPSQENDWLNNTRLPTVDCDASAQITIENSSRKNENQMRCTNGSRIKDSLIKSMKNAYGHARAEGLSKSFKSYSSSSLALKQCILAFTLYFVFGALIFSLRFDHWTLIDSAYMAVITFTTCGYGDITPNIEESSFELIMTIIYVLVGVLVVATLAFNVLSENIFDAYDKIINSVKAAKNENFLKQFSFSKVVDSHHDMSSKEQQQSEHMSIEIIVVMASMIPLFSIMFAVAFFIGYIEGWSILKTLYFVVITSTTVGYGDVSPSTQGTRLICVIFIPFSVIVMGKTLGRLAGVYLKNKAEETENDFMNRRLTREDLNVMDINGDKEVSKEEFMRFMLVAMGKVTHEDLDKLQHVFEKLDVTCDGCLSLDDIIMMAKINR